MKYLLSAADFVDRNTPAIEEVVEIAGDLVLSDGQKRALGKVRKGVKKVVGSKMYSGVKSKLAQHVYAGPGVITAPVSQSVVVRGRKPKISSIKGGAVVTHREMFTTVGDANSVLAVNGGSIAGGASPVSSSYNLQVCSTNVNLFPWLSTLACSYDQYKFTSITVTYVPICASTQVSRVVLGWDSDANDSVPPSRGDFANLPANVATPAWAPVSLTIPCDGKWRFTTSGNVVYDQTLFNMGALYYAVTGTGTTAVLGDLFVDYTVQLKSPTLEGVAHGYATTTPTTITRIDGPQFPFKLSSTATSMIFSFFTDGTYKMFITGNSTSGAGSAPAGANGVTFGTADGLVLNSSANGRFGYFLSFNVQTTSGATPTLTLGGLTAWTVADVFWLKGGEWVNAMVTV